MGIEIFGSKFIVNEERLNNELDRQISYLTINISCIFYGTLQVPQSTLLSKSLH